MSTCQKCNKEYTVDLITPNSIWNIITGKSDGSGMLCPNCICELIHQHKLGYVPADIIGANWGEQHPDNYRRLRNELDSDCQTPANKLTAHEAWVRTKEIFKHINKCKGPTGCSVSLDTAAPGVYTGGSECWLRVPELGFMRMVSSGPCELILIQIYDGGRVLTEQFQIEGRMSLNNGLVLYLNHKIEYIVFRTSFDSFDESYLSIIEPTEIPTSKSES